MLIWSGIASSDREGFAAIVGKPVVRSLPFYRIGLRPDHFVELYPKTVELDLIGPAFTGWERASQLENRWRDEADARHVHRIPRHCP